MRGAIRLVWLDAKRDGEIVAGGGCVQGVITGVNKDGDKV